MVFGFRFTPAAVSVLWAVLTAFAECLHSLGYGEALEEAQRLIEPPAAKPPQPFATTAAPAPEV